MIVPPGTAASAAAFTLSAVVPVSSVSPGPCETVAGFGALFVAAAAAVVDDDDPVAAPAMVAPPSAAPTVAAPTTSHVRRRFGWDSLIAPCAGGRSGIPEAVLMLRSRRGSALI